MKIYKKFNYFVNVLYLKTFCLTLCLDKSTQRLALSRLLCVFIGFLMCSVRLFSNENDQNKIQAIVVAIDHQQKSLRIRHKPTGYERDLVWNDRTLGLVTEKIDIDRIPLGVANFWLGKVDLDKKYVAKIVRIQPLADSEAKHTAPTNTNNFIAELIREKIDEREVPSTLLSIDKKYAYWIVCNGDRWAIRGDARPILTL